MEITYSLQDTAVGNILIASTKKGVCAVILGDTKKQLLQDLQDRFPSATFVECSLSKVFSLQKAKLDLHGTPFQQNVWKALQSIPKGKTSTYADIAKKIGKPKAVRAVAQACGANPIAIRIPCHRVVRSDGAISGYRWGVERKRALLQAEGIQVS